MTAPHSSEMGVLCILKTDPKVGREKHHVGINGRKMPIIDYGFSHAHQLGVKKRNSPSMYHGGNILSKRANR